MERGEKVLEGAAKSARGEGSVRGEGNEGFVRGEQEKGWSTGRGSWEGTERGEEEEEEEVAQGEGSVRGM